LSHRESRAPNPDFARPSAAFTMTAPVVLEAAIGHARLAEITAGAPLGDGVLQPLLGQRVGSVDNLAQRRLVVRLVPLHAIVRAREVELGHERLALGQLNGAGEMF